MLVLFTDTDTDFTPELAKQYDCHLISMPYSVDGKTIYPYEDFDVFEGKKFYNMLRSGVLPTTSAISESRYTEYFEPFFANGDDILYVHFSRAMSMTFGNMDAAVAKLLEKYPERKFYTIDTKGITITSFIIIDEIGQMYKAGKSVEEMISWAEKEVDHFSTYFYANDLKFFKRSGRVSGITAAMGTLIGVRPIIHINKEGKMVSIGKERGKKNALNRLLQYTIDKGEDIKAHKVVIAHSDADEDVAELKALLRAQYGDDLNIQVVIANPTSGSHCGPDCVGIAFHSSGRE
ncbi:MAG: DegV family protein [Clostridia bacterium]|nr:DegV family protein [Clostridia bacterium]